MRRPSLLAVAFAGAVFSIALAGLLLIAFPAAALPATRGPDLGQPHSQVVALPLRAGDQAPATDVAAHPTTGATRDSSQPGEPAWTATAFVDPAVRAAIAAEPTRPISVLVHVRLPDHGEAAPRSADSSVPSGGTAALVGPDRLAQKAGATRLVAGLQANFQLAAASLLQDLQVANRDGRVARFAPLWIAGSIAVTAAPDYVMHELVLRPEVTVITLDRLITLDGQEERTALDRQAAIERRIALDTQVSLGLQVAPAATAPVQPNIHLIRADLAWNLLHIDGAGVTVAVVDTGVDYNHPLLKKQYRGFVPGSDLPDLVGNWWCKVVDAMCGRGSRYPVDANGHGTHVLGTILGQEGIGVAPGATWIAARACASDKCPTSWIVEALQWMLAMDDAHRPDVVNLSLGTPAQDQLLDFKPSADALVAAGVVLVAATGNDYALVNAPSIYPSVVGVGAVDNERKVWNEGSNGQGSGFGDSLAGEVKPDVVAPGVAITSTVPGGGFASDTGTSMATPHVTGVAALLLQAKPQLTPAEVLQILRRTAVTLGSGTPDARTGWGLVDAYAAVASVLDVGQVHGRVVRKDGGTPIPWARVRLALPNGDPVPGAEVDVDADGRFRLNLAPGSYVLIAEAFSFQRQTRRDIQIVTGVDLDLGDLALEYESPLGTFQGFLYDAQTGARIDGDLVLEGIPVPPIHADANLGFSQQLPVQTYGIRIQKFGYRVIHDEVKVLAGPLPTERSYRLEPAPKILLVDGDAWTYSGAIAYFREALTNQGYLFHERRLTLNGAAAGSPEGPPTAAQMATYDLVIWFNTLSSPAAARAGNELANYLAGGGRLILSGQDTLCLDAGDNANAPCYGRRSTHPYVKNQLYLRVAADNAPSRLVNGSPGGPLDGMAFRLNGQDSLDNQNMPDVLAVADDLHTSLIAEYAGDANGNGSGGGAVAWVNRCVPHRAIAFGFGLEGVAGAGTRADLLERSIRAVMAPPPDYGVVLRPNRLSGVAMAGSNADYLVTLHNTGRLTTEFAVTATGWRWPTGVWQPGFGTPLTSTVRLAPCEVVPFGVRVAVPPDALRGEFDGVTVTVSARNGPVVAQLAFRTRTQGAVLLVDGDFNQDSEGAYVKALDALDIAYDTWEFGRLNLAPVLPTSRTLAGYPVVVWFTGRDFIRQRTAGLNPETQQMLSDYLLGGGRLYFSSEDYLLLRGGTPYTQTRLFHRDFMGVDRFVSDVGGVYQGTLRGGAASLFADVKGCTVRSPSRDQDFSDVLTPLPYAEAALLNLYGEPVATQVAAAGFKTVFLAFDAGQIAQDCATELLRRSLDWFSPLTLSDLSVVDARGTPLGAARRSFRSGDLVRLQLLALNESPRGLGAARIAWRLPAGSQLEGSPPPGWQWDPAARLLTWAGPLPPAQRQTPAIQLRLDPDLAPDTRMTATAEFFAEGISITRKVGWGVNAPNLQNATKSIPDAQRVRKFGDRVKFVLNIENTGTRQSASFTLTDTLPAGLLFLPDTLSSANEPVDALPEGGLVWHGPPLDPGRSATLSYEAKVVTHVGGWLRNQAVLSEPSGERVTMEAAVFVRPQLLFPWLGWQRVLDP